MRSRLLLVLSVASLLASASGRAQLQLVPVSQQTGLVGLGLVLRQLNTVGTFMHTTAHPDDENNGLLAQYAHGRGYRTVLASATRGEGGQNEIGPELFDALSVLRTEELLAAHRFDGAEQYFTRAVDFGYSFSLEETFEKWDRNEILRDFVRLIRTVRPDVIVSLPTEGTGGGLHHQASARITAEAFRAAADPARFPEQLAEGLRPWQPLKLYSLAWRGFPGERQPPADAKLVAMDGGTYDPLLGRTYEEIGSAARSMHKCQGMPQLLALPGQYRPRYRLADTILDGQRDRQETDLFDGVDTSLEGLAAFAGDSAPPALGASLAAIASAARTALERFETAGADAALPAILEGLSAVRRARAALASMSLDARARFEIDFRLAPKVEQFERAAVLAAGLRVEALVDDGLVTPGQAVKLNVLVANRGPRPIALRSIELDGFDGGLSECAAAPIAPDAVAGCQGEVRIGPDEPITGAYWHRDPEAARYIFEQDAPFGVPFRPSPFQARVTLDVGGVPVELEHAVQYRYERDIFTGEKRMGPKVVPAFSVRATPDIAIVPAGALTAGGAASIGARELRVTVTNHKRGPATGEVTLEAPDGWTVTPAVQPVGFSREDEEQTVKFAVAPARGAAAGGYRVRAAVKDAESGARYDRGFQVIEYPHIQRRHLLTVPEPLIKVIDVALAPDLSVGYIMGVGDQVPQAIEQLGAAVTFLGADDLAWGDLSRFDVIVTGVRAYERRDDLRAHNERLLKYAEAGGTVIVQYNKFEFNQAQYGPYPAKVSSNRVTDEHAPVSVPLPGHPAFNFPNEIGDEDWQGWVQERGLYFLGEKDARYRDLVQLEDSFPNNAGVKTGALVEAPVGAGRWVYVGLGLWRQLPAGTDGAYRLLANLLSLPRAAADSGLQSPAAQIRR